MPTGTTSELIQIFEHKTVGRYTFYPSNNIGFPGHEIDKLDGKFNFAVEPHLEYSGKHWRSEPIYFAIPNLSSQTVKTINLVEENDRTIYPFTYTLSIRTINNQARYFILVLLNDPSVTFMLEGGCACYVKIYRIRDTA